jgi:HSP20 family protein
MLTRWSDVDRIFKTINLLRNNLDGFSSEFDQSYPWSVGWPGETSTPRTNLYDLGDTFAVWAEVPGLAKDELAVKIQGNYVELSGTRKFAAPEGYSTHRTERKMVSFTRSFTLPADIDVDKVEAHLQNGILHMSLPKSAAAKPRQIAIG